MKWSEDNIRYLKENYGKIKAKEIAAVLGRSYDAIHKKARSLKLIGDRGINRKYTVNHNYFSEVTLENSYWAGFIAADGCITKNYVKIMIAQKDLKILEMEYSRKKIFNIRASKGKIIESKFLSIC